MSRRRQLISALIMVIGAFIYCQSFTLQCLRLNIVVNSNGFYLDFQLTQCPKR